MQEQASIITILKRGLRLRCPNCGQGRLLKGYLKQVDTCSSCGEALGHIRADDAPPWLTILVTGHIMASVILVFESYKLIPLWQELAIMESLSLLCIYFILPRAKGFFIALTWALRRKKTA